MDALTSAADRAGWRCGCVVRSPRSSRKGRAGWCVRPRVNCRPTGRSWPPVAVRSAKAFSGWPTWATPSCIPCLALHLQPAGRIHHEAHGRGGRSRHGPCRRHEAVLHGPVAGHPLGAPADRPCCGSARGGARELHERGYRYTVRIDWTGGLGELPVRERLRDLRDAQARKLLRNAEPYGLPARLWDSC